MKTQADKECCADAGSRPSKKLQPRNEESKLLSGRSRKFEGFYVRVTGGWCGMYSVEGRRFQSTLKRSACRTVPVMCCMVCKFY